MADNVFFYILNLIIIIVDLMHVRNLNEHLCSWMLTWLNKILLLLLLENPHLQAFKMSPSNWTMIY